MCFFVSRWNKIFKSRFIQTVALYGNTSFMVVLAILVFLLIGTFMPVHVSDPLAVDSRRQLSFIHAHFILLPNPAIYKKKRKRNVTLIYCPVTKKSFFKAIKPAI